MALITVMTLVMKETSVVIVALVVAGVVDVVAVEMYTMDLVRMEAIH